MPSKSETDYVSTSQVDVVSTTNYYGTVTSDSYRLNLARGYIRSSMLKTWVVTPGYREKVKRGEVLPDNSFFYEKKKGIPSRITVNQYDRVPAPANYWSNSRKSFTMQLAYHPVWAPSIPLLEVQTKLLNKAKQHQWNVPIFLGEARKTADMVVSRAQGLVNLLRAARRGDVGYFLDNLKATTPTRKRNKITRDFNSDFGRDGSRAVANLWLETQYGWKPFMGDVYDAMTTLMDLADTPSRRTGQVSASVTRTFITKSPEERVLALPEASIYLRGFNYVETKESLKATWRFSQRPADLVGRLGLLNPLPIVWELTPFSFVADWFVPIGDYLEALDAGYRFFHVGGTYGRKIETTVRTTAVRCESSSQTISNASQSVAQTLKVERQVMGGVPQPRLGDLVFDQGGVQGNRVPNLIALMRVLLPR